MDKHMPPILHLEDTKEKPMRIELNGNRITGIQEYTVTRKTCDPVVELNLKLVCYIGEIKIDREKSKSKSSNVLVSKKSLYKTPLENVEKLREEYKKEDC